MLRPVWQASQEVIPTQRGHFLSARFARRAAFSSPIQGILIGSATPTLRKLNDEVMPDFLLSQAFVIH